MTLSPSHLARSLVAVSLGTTVCFQTWALFLGLGQLSPVAKAINTAALMLLIGSSVVLRRSRPQSALSPLGDNITTLNLTAPAIGDEGQDQGRK